MVMISINAVLILLISFVNALTIPPIPEFHEPSVPNIEDNISTQKDLESTSTTTVEDDSVEEKTEIIFDRDQLDQLTSELLAAVKTKFEVQQKIAEFSRMVHVQNGDKSDKTLDVVSKKIAETLKSNSNPSELNFLMTGIAQTAAEVAIISSINDLNVAPGLSGKDENEITLLRNRRSVAEDLPVDKKVGKKDNLPQKENSVISLDNILKRQSNSSLPTGPEFKRSKFSLLNPSQKKPFNVVFRKKPTLRIKNYTAFEGFLSIMNIEVSPFLGKEGMQALRGASAIIRFTTASVLASRRVFEDYNQVKILKNGAKGEPTTDSTALQKAKEYAKKATDDAKSARHSSIMAEKGLGELTRYAGSNGMVNRVMIEVVQANSVAKALSTVAAEHALLAFRDAFADS